MNVVRLSAGVPILSLPNPTNEGCFANVPTTVSILHASIVRGGRDTVRRDVEAIALLPARGIVPDKKLFSDSEQRKGEESSQSLSAMLGKKPVHVYSDVGAAQTRIPLLISFRHILVH